MGIDSFFREGKEAIKPILWENSDMVGLLLMHKTSLYFVSPSWELFGTSAKGNKNVMEAHSHHKNSLPGFWPSSFLLCTTLTSGIFLGKSFKFQRNKNKLD